MTSSVAMTNTSKMADLRGTVAKNMEKIVAAMPSQIAPERFLEIFYASFRDNPKLYKCSNSSLINALMQSVKLGLEPNGVMGKAYIIPYGNEAQFQVGYQGLLDLAWRSGKVKSISASVVYSEDVFEFEL